MIEIWIQVYHDRNMDTGVMKRYYKSWLSFYSLLIKWFVLFWLTKFKINLEHSVLSIIEYFLRNWKFLRKLDYIFTAESFYLWDLRPIRERNSFVILNQKYLLWEYLCYYLLYYLGLYQAQYQFNFLI